MKQAFFAMAVLGSTACLTEAATLPNYYPTEDVFIRQGATYDSASNSYTYQQTSNRLAKGFGASSGNKDGYIAAFNTAAIKTAVESQLGHSINTVGDLAGVTATWNLKRADTTNGDTTGSYTPAVYMGAPITSSSDFSFQKNATVANGGNVQWTGISGSGGSAGTAVDDWAGGTGQNGLTLVPTRNASATVWGNYDTTVFRPFDLDSAVLFALLTDARARGLTMVGANDTPHNLYVYGRDADGSATTNDPYLSITVVPEPASLSMLGLCGLMALRRRRQA
jgi:hypothetical protein